MSRWLKQVNTLLENLDDTVGDAVEKAEERMEERMEMEQGYASASSLSDHDGAAPAMGSAKASVDDILARRGLLEEEEPYFHAIFSWKGASSRHCCEEPRRTTRRALFPRGRKSSILTGPIKKRVFPLEKRVFASRLVESLGTATNC